MELGAKLLLAFLGLVVMVFGTLICLSAGDSVVRWVIGGWFILLGCWVVVYPVLRSSKNEHV